MKIISILIIAALCLLFLSTFTICEEDVETPTNTTSIKVGSTTTTDSAVTETMTMQDDEDLEDYDQDDFAILGNEYLLREIKAIEEQIKDNAEEAIKSTTTTTGTTTATGSK
ncbi:hypothetical protein ABK040_001332 [Willaertia magna]